MNKPKKDQEVLNPSKDFLTNIIDATGDPIFVKDVDSKFIIVNDALCNMLGIARENIIGKTLAESLPKDQMDHFLKVDSEVLDTGIENQCEELLTGQDGKLRTIVTKKTRYTDEQGEMFLIGVIHDITERKQLEEALRKSEENYRLQFLNMNSYNSLYEVVTNKDGKPCDFRFIMVNHAYEKYVGKNARELIGKTLLEVYPATEQYWIDKMTEVVLTGVPSHFENFSQVMNTHTEINLYVPQMGQLAMTTGNIDDRKRAEEALRDSERHLKNSQKMAHLGSWRLDVATNQVVWTEELYNMYGFDPALPPPPYTEHMKLFTPASWERLSTSLANTRETGLPYELELEMVKKDGSRGWIWVRGEAIKDLEGNTIGLWGAAQDITERKQTERQLAFHASLHDQVHNAVIAIDLENKILFWNRHAETLYQWKRSEAVGKDIIELLSPQEMKNDVHINFAALNRDGHWEGEFDVLRKDGSTIPAHITNTMLMDLDGKHIGFIGISEDITERKRIETALQNTQKLESLGMLAGGIAHDFNNLMGGIFSYIDMASENVTEVKTTLYLSKAMNTIDRARALTQQLLTFAKGGAPIQKIGHLFPFIEETAKFALSGAHVSCNFDVPQDLWACNFDKNQIGQVIDNIVINAQQAMPVGGTIELSARNITLAEKEHPLLKKGNYVKISITDTGIGISKELLAKIFDPFFTTKATGHGLGLATCYSIIKRHDGCIDVDSEPGIGSTFKVYLPASMESASSDNQKAAKVHKGSGTFLIMDDEEVMRDTIGDMLETLGYTVVSKENGNDAIDFVMKETKANCTIAGMIFDLTVPGGMGGKAAIEEIRKTNREIPAFVASGYADDPVMKNPTEYGFMASICKPFRKTELSEMLNKYLKPNK